MNIFKTIMSDWEMIHSFGTLGNRFIHFQFDKYTNMKLQMVSLPLAKTLGAEETSGLSPSKGMKTKRPLAPLGPAGQRIQNQDLVAVS